MHMAYLCAKISIYPARKAQIALLLAEEVIVLDEYSDFANIFLKDSAAELSKYSNINEYAIDLKPGKQPSYTSIYSPGPIELKTLKTYIETNMVNSFIWPSKSLARVLILFGWKSDSSLCLCVNYCGLNNLIIQNQYPLSLIDELFNQ